jgi:putative tricarboxylic transport membrane protein
VIGVVSYLMIKFGYPVIPVLLGLVLGPLAETNLRRSLLISHGDLMIFLQRPISAIFIAVLGFSLLLYLVRSRKRPKRGRS